MTRTRFLEGPSLSDRLKTIRCQLRRSRRLSRLWEFLLENATDPKTNLPAAARHVGMHQDHLNATLKKTAGVTFGQLLSLHRSQRALRLMEKRSLSLAEICFECGFGSGVTFWRHLRRHLGCAPSKWRAKVLQEHRSVTAFQEPKKQPSQRKSRNLK